MIQLMTSTQKTDNIREKSKLTKVQGQKVEVQGQICNYTAKSYQRNKQKS